MTGQTVVLRMLDRPSEPYVFEGLTDTNVDHILKALTGEPPPGYTSLVMPQQNVTVWVNRAMICAIEVR